MLYSLFNHFNEVLGARLFTYISFRAITSGVLALCVSVWFGNWFINYMKRHNISETQRDEKTDPFNVNKKGVPTMGGLIVIIAILLPCLLMGNLSNVYMILMLVTTVLMGLLGFADDYIKTRPERLGEDWRTSSAGTYCRSDTSFCAGSHYE